MDLKYMLLKDRYTFLYTPNTLIYDIEKIKKNSIEISLYLKELSLYSISLKQLSEKKPSFNLKNELLNVAFACIEEKSLYEDFRKKRTLPIKKVHVFTNKSINFLEKWKHLISAYVIILSGKNYNNIKSYLSIKLKEDKFTDTTASLGVYDDKKTSETSSTFGIILKLNKSKGYILTPLGDFIYIKLDNKDTSIGETCKGKIKHTKNLYKYIVLILTIIVFCAIIFTSIYLKPKRRVYINGYGSIQLTTNYLDKTVELEALDSKANKITNNLKLFNSSLDESIYTILKNAKDQNLITSSTSIQIFISGLQDVSPNLTKTSAYISSCKLSVKINCNGTEIKLKNNNK